MTKEKLVEHWSAQKRRFRLFVPILAGARLGERMVACLGALLGIALTALICRYVLGQSPSLPLVVAPLGASAVLLFAVPSSPLAQPWSILGGNVVSAVTGVLIFKIFGHSALALGVAVACAILAMSLLRCPHPPGGAVAMTAVIGGPAIWHAGFAFPFDVVALNSFVLIATG
jgi:CBS domain-containing membrane protein